MFSREKKIDRKEEIIEKIILEKYNYYFRMAMSFVHNEHDASDIVQEGAYKAIKNSDSLKDINFAETWVYRIMLNEVYKVLEASKKVSLDDEQNILEPKYEDSYEDIDLKKALDKMEPKDKAVIELRFFEDKKLDEIALIMDESLSTVKSRLYRALKKLRLEMEDADDKEAKQNE